MSEPSDVERAKRELIDRIWNHTEDRQLLIIDLGRLLDQHSDRLTRELQEAHTALDNCGVARGAFGHSIRYRIGLLGEEAAEVADLRAKLAAVESERDALNSEKADALWVTPAFRDNALGSELARLEARLAERQWENERLQQTLKLQEGPHVTMTTERADELEKAEAALAAERERRERLETALAEIRGWAGAPESAEAVWEVAERALARPHLYTRRHWRDVRCAICEAPEAAHTDEALRAQEPQPSE